MPTPTIAVTCAASDQGGESVAGGIYTAKLDQTEIYDGFVVPEQVTATADADGLAILNLWPNALGVNGSSYRITARNPDTGKKFFDASVVVPNNPCNLYQIIQNAPFPNVDSAQQALIDVQALVTIANQDVAATNADAQQAAADRLQTGEDRTAARDSAANALTSENTASDKAAEASGHANAASGQADLATNAAATTQTLRDSIIATQGSIGYLPPVAYAAGLSMTLPAQTVNYLGQTYAPILSVLPFTTSGTFEAAKFRLIQGVAGVDLAAPGGAGMVGIADALNRFTASTTEGALSEVALRNGETAQDFAAKIVTGAADAVFNSVQVGAGAGSITDNTSVGRNSMDANTTGFSNTSLGWETLQKNTTGSNNTAAGRSALRQNTTGANHTAFGVNALAYSTTGTENTGIGRSALNHTTAATDNTAVGYKALQDLTSKIATLGAITGGAGYTAGTYNGVTLQVASGTAPNAGDGPQALAVANITVSGGAVTAVALTGFGGGLDLTTVLTATAASIGGTGAGFSVPVATLSDSSRNTAVGNNAGTGISASSDNTAVGFSVMVAGAGNFNTGMGSEAFRDLSTGNHNTAIGRRCMLETDTGNFNTAVGSSALANSLNTTNNNVAVGYSALNGNAGSCAIACTALGYNALTAFNFLQNCTALGANATVTSNNQVQLGDSATTTYAYGAVQARSDGRDKADVRDTVLGLDFINSLRPVDYRWDYRSDYNGSAKDGSQKRARFHHGLIAQEVQAVIAKSGVDFGGFQDHAVAGGDDVLSIGYGELVAPLIKAVQQLSADVAALHARSLDSQAGKSARAPAITPRKHP